MKVFDSSSDIYERSYFFSLYVYVYEGNYGKYHECIQYRISYRTFFPVVYNMYTTMPFFPSCFSYWIKYNIYVIDRVGIDGHVLPLGRHSLD